MTALSDLLNHAKGDRVVDRLIDAARLRGVEVSESARSNVYKALKGNHAKNPTDKVLNLWADIFDVKVTALREAAGKPAGELGPWVPVGESGQLSQPIRNALDDLIKAIVKEGGGAHGAAATSTPPDEGGNSNVVELPGPAIGLLVKRYLKEAGGNVAAAGQQLAADGAHGANVDRETWEAGLEWFSEMSPTAEMPLELPGDVAARRSEKRPPQGPGIQGSD